VNATNRTEPVRRRAIYACLGLMLIFPFFSVSVQGATADLAPRIGEMQARIVTETAIWLYAALVLGIALLGERRTLASIGLRRPTFGTLAWGLGGAVAILVLGALASFVTYNVLHQSNHTPEQIEALLRGSLVYALFLALRGGVIEELFYRGLAIEQLSALTGNRWLAAVSATIVFVLVHGLRFDLLQLIPIATASFGFMGLHLWRHNLLVNMIGHVTIDAVAFSAVALHATDLY
jgi:membrane protease YdiL (CAAX protease family)